LDRLDPLAPEAQCSRCGVPFENPAPLHGSPLCGLCRRGATPFEWARGFGAYEEDLRRVVHLLKYSRMEALARPLGARLAGLLAQAGPVDLIVPVPLYWWRRWRRGFNQSELLAREVSRLAGVPCGRNVLVRRKNTESQTGLTNRQRRLNVQGAFVVRRPDLVAGRAVAVVDDVITTGATVGACARALKRAGAARVVIVALARARRRWVDLPAAAAPPPPRRREAVCTP
jgi:ComF family protein